MKVSEIKEICLKGSRTYYNYLESKPNGGVEEVEISAIEKINQETFKFKIAKKLFDLESLCFRYNGQISKTFTVNDIQIKVYDNSKRTLVVKVSKEVQQYINLLVNRDWKIIIDLKFLVQRVIDWYELNGNKLKVLQEKCPDNKFDESVIFNEKGYIPSIEQKEAIYMLFNNSLSYVWGAPGTGKTRFVLSYSILSYIKKEKKVLVLAPTNVALEQVLSGVLEMTDKAKLKRSNILRLGFPTQEFANQYGEICEIQGLEKELKKVSDQIKILTSILGIQNDKETELRSSIDILTRAVDLDSKLKSKKQVQTEISANLSRHQSNKRTQQSKYQVLELEKKSLIEKKNSIAGKIFGFLSRQVDYDKEIGGLIQKQMILEDSIFKLNSLISNGKSQLDSIKIELNSIQIEVRTNNELLEELGITEDRASSNFTNTLEMLKRDLEREIDDQQVYKSLSKEYDNLSTSQLQQQLNLYIDKKNKLENYSLEARIENALVIGATIDAFLYRFKDKVVDFAHIFIDEAGYASIIKALTVFTSKTPVTFLGDHKQLPPVCELSKLDIKKNKDYTEVFTWDQSAIFIGDFWNSKKLDDALQIYLNEVAPSNSYLTKSSLTESFRFGPNLAEVLDHYVYEEGFTSNEEEDTDIVICNVSNPPEARGRGRLNEAEAIAIQKLVERNFKESDSVAILSPYRDQVNALKKILPEFKDENKILTVHKSQGREWDTVIYSVCDIGNGKSPWFTDSTSTLSSGLNNVNTAVSRARKRLIICCCQQEWSNRSDQLIHGLLNAATSIIDYDSSHFTFSQIRTNNSPRNQNDYHSIKLSESVKTKRVNTKVNINSNALTKTDDEWESKTLCWSKSRKPGFAYSSKKEAWWKSK